MNEHTPVRVLNPDRGNLLFRPVLTGNLLFI